MNRLILLLLATAAVILVASNQALAVKMQTKLSPSNLKQEGFTLSTTKHDDGTLDLTITRDLAKARSFDPASELELVRTATFELTGPAGTILRCNLEPEIHDATVIYHFTLGQDQLPHARLTISEIDDYKKSAHREHLIGGGTFFELKLSDLITP